MTRKQYYLRLGKLVKLDLIKKVGKRYTLTIFGYVVYETQLTLIMAITGYIPINSVNLIPTNEGIEVANEMIL